MLLACLVALAGAACSSAGPGHRIAADGVGLVVPSGWQRIEAAVVGTKGVRPRGSQCQIAAYRVQPRGAVVVVVGWASIASSGGGPMTHERSPLEQLTSVRRPSFECFGGRGTAAQVLLDEHAYQINVMVGDHASPRLVSDALAVARTFDVVR
jgi:hypothetical protein